MSSPPIPSPPIKSPAAPRPSPFLHLAAIGLAISAMVGLYRGFQWWLISALDGHDGLQAVMQISAVGDGLAGILIVAGILGAALRLRGPMILAAVGAGVFTLQVTLWALPPFLAASELAALLHTIPWPVYLLAPIAMDVGIIATLDRQQSLRLRRASGLVSVATGAALLFWGWIIANRLGFTPAFTQGPAGYLIHSVVEAVHTGVAVAMLLALARMTVGEPRTGAQATEASSGLRLFSTGLKLRIVCLVATVGLSLVLAASRSPDGLKTVLYGGTILSMIAGVVMVAGLARYAFSGGSHDVSGTLATVLMTAGLLLDLWVLQLLNALFGRQVGAALTAQESLGWAQGIGQVIGLIAMLALLTSLRQVARFGGNPLLARRAGGLMGLVVLVAGLATAVRVLAGARSLSAALVLVLGVGALIAAIVMIMRLLVLISDAARQLEDDAAAGDAA